MNHDDASQTLFNLLVTKNFDPQALDAQGKPSAPEDATMFSFDYTGSSGKDYGTVVLLLGDDLDVFCGDNTGKSIEDGEDRKEWFDDFLYQLKNWSVRNVPGTLNIQNLNKLKYSMQGQAAIKEGLFEGWSGKKDVSWNAAPTEARLMIKHKRVIGEGEARYRYIESLFIETAEGERFKLPFESLAAGKAMLEHVRQGGKPYDIRGNHIGTIVQEMKLLNRFQRASQGKIFEGETAHLVEEAAAYYETLKHNLKSLTTRNGYKKYFESWSPANITDEDVIIEDLRHLFVEQNIDSRVEQALPLLAKLKQEQAMKEINVFEGWMNLLSEGTWALPDTPQKQSQLVELLSQELPVGADATNATEQLYDILGDDELFDQLGDLARKDANADARTIILNRLEQMKSNPAVAQVIGKLKIETNPTEQPAEQPAGDEELNEFAPGGGHGDEDHLHKLAKQWSDAGDDYDAQEAAEEALEKFGYGISEIEDGSGAIQLVPTGEYMIDWNDNDIIVFNPEDLDENREVDPPEFDSEVEESFNSYDIDNTPCPKCHEKELTYHQGTNHVQCGACGRGFSLAGKSISEAVMGGGGMQRVFKNGQWVKPEPKQPAPAKPTPAKEAAGDVMFKDQERLDRLESLRSFAKAVGNTAKADELDRQIKAIYAANPVGMREEELDELSPDTLGRYAKKAHGNAMYHDAKAGMSSYSDDERDAAAAKGISRTHGVRRAIDKLTDKAGQLDELSPETLKSYIKKASSSNDERSASNLASRAADKLHTGDQDDVNWDDGSDDDHKSFMRSKGIARAVDKLEELSPDTLKSYVKKASSDRAIRNFDQGFDTGKSFDKREPDYDYDNARRDDSRRKGIRKAVDRLEESGMGEVDLLLQEIARGNVDIYDIYAAPKSNIEKFVSDQIHEKAEEVAREQGYHLDDDIEDILARVQRELEVEYGTDDNMDIEMDEGAIGRTLGGIAGVALAGGPEDPLSIPAYKVGSELGDKLGDKIGSYFSKNKETDESSDETRLKVSPHDAGSFAALKGKSYDSNPHPKGSQEHLLWSKGHNAMRARKADMDETVGGGNWLEENGSVVDQIKQVQDEIEKIVRSGGRVGLNDPLSRKLKMLKAKLQSSKMEETDAAGALSNEDMNESTALQGQYGHSGKLQAVQPQDQDMMDRIKFLAGITK